MKPIHLAFHATILSRIQKCVLLLLILCLIIGSTMSAAQADNTLLASVVEHGMELYDALPNIHGSKVIGYNYYSTLPWYWAVNLMPTRAVLPVATT